MYEEKKREKNNFRILVKDIDIHRGEKGKKKRGSRN
jgi:hypothetical protein